MLKLMGGIVPSVLSLPPFFLFFIHFAQLFIFLLLPPPPIKKHKPLKTKIEPETHIKYQFVPLSERILPFFMFT
jgi:hypothetical protein